MCVIQRQMQRKHTHSSTTPQISSSRTTSKTNTINMYQQHNTHSCNVWNSKTNENENTHSETTPQISSSRTTNKTNTINMHQQNNTHSCNVWNTKTNENENTHSEATPQRSISRTTNMLYDLIDEQLYELL